MNKTTSKKIVALTELVRGTDWVEADLLDQVQVLRMIRETADSALRSAVEEAAQYETWESIARMLGVSRQSAWERYR